MAEKKGSTSEKTLYCSFCGKSQHEVKKLIAHFFYAIPFIDMEWFNVIYWTLAVEIQFYVIVGFIFPLLNSKNEVIKYIQAVFAIYMKASTSFSN